MQLLGIMASLIVAMLVGAVNGWMSWTFQFDVTNILLLVIPIGAYLVGFPSGFVLSFVSSIRGSKPSFAGAAIMFGIACAVGTLTILSYHFYSYLEEGAPSLGIGFGEYHSLVLSSYSISFRGNSEFALGEWGEVLGYSEYIAAALGSLSGWITGFGASRTAGGVSSIPDYYDDIADLLVAIATIDGKARRSESTMAAKGLALTMDAWFESPGKKLSDQLSKLADQKIEQALQKIETNGSRPIDLIVRSIPKNERTLSLLVGAAAWSVAAADADVSPRELSELRHAMTMLGLSESDWAKIEELGMIQIAGNINALNQATPLKVARVELEHVTFKRMEDPEMPGSAIGAIGLVRSELGTIYRVGYVLHCTFVRSGPQRGDVFHTVDVWADRASANNEDDENAPIHSFRVFECEFEVGEPRVNRHGKLLSALMLSDEYPRIGESIAKSVQKGVHIRFRLTNGEDVFQALFPGADKNPETMRAWEEYENHKRRLANDQ